MTTSSASRALLVVALLSATTALFAQASPPRPFPPRPPTPPPSPPRLTATDRQHMRELAEEFWAAAVNGDSGEILRLGGPASLHWVAITARRDSGYFSRTATEPPRWEMGGYMLGRTPTLHASIRLTLPRYRCWRQPPAPIPVAVEFQLAGERWRIGHIAEICRPEFSPRVDTSAWESLNPALWMDNYQRALVIQRHQPRITTDSVRIAADTSRVWPQLVFSWGFYPLPHYPGAFLSSVVVTFRGETRWLSSMNRLWETLLQDGTRPTSPAQALLLCTEFVRAVGPRARWDVLTIGVDSARFTELPSSTRSKLSDLDLSAPSVVHTDEPRGWVAHFWSLEPGQATNYECRLELDGAATLEELQVVPGAGLRAYPGEAPPGMLLAPDAKRGAGPQTSSPPNTPPAPTPRR